MAAGDEKTTVEVSEETTTAKIRPKGVPKKLVLFGSIGFGCVLVGVVLAIFVVRPMIADSGGAGVPGETSRVVESTDASRAQDTERDRPEPRKRKRKSAHGSAESVVYAIKDIVVNPAGTGGSRFLSVSLGFELESAELAQEFEDREPVVRDALITILSSKTVAQLTDTKQKEIIRYQIKKRVSTLLDTDELTGVYYTDFVLQ